MTVPDRLIDILTVGESLGLVVPDEAGHISSAQPAHLRFGGAESNLAIAAARLGAKVTWVSRLGSDGLGDLIERTLRGEGVTVIAPRDPVRLTGIMLKERPVPGRARVRYYRARSAATVISPEDLPDGLIRSARLIHLTGITPALSGSARDTVRSVTARARTAGALVSFDVNFRSALWSADEAQAELLELMPSVDLLFAGLDEAALLDERIQTPEDAVKLFDRFPLRQVVIKLGAGGAVALAGSAVTRAPAHVVEVVDSVGAGDAFVAGYLTAYLAGAPVAGCLARGNAVGAFACMVAGDWEGAPSLDDLAMLEPGDPVTR